MKKLVVDAEGKLIIPAQVLAKRGLRPGDELMVVEAAEGLLIYQGGVDPLTARWWNGLSEDEQREARAEAQHYEDLCEEEKDRMWEGNA